MLPALRLLSRENRGAWMQRNLQVRAVGSRCGVCGDCFDDRRGENGFRKVILGGSCGSYFSARTVGGSTREDTKEQGLNKLVQGLQASQAKHHTTCLAGRNSAQRLKSFFSIFPSSAGCRSSRHPIPIMRDKHVGDTVCSGSTSETRPRAVYPTPVHTPATLQ